ncbi:MAG: hypothetical protein ACRC8S_09250 [Fimbriiglobus sp.]
MTRKLATNRAPESDWWVASLRLTVLSQPFPVALSSGLWERIVGQAPDSSTHITKTGERIELGPVHEMQLTLNANPNHGRVDWELLGTVELSAQPAVTLLEAGKQFLDRMAVFLKTDGLPLISRMALGAKLLLPVDNPEQGYSILCDYLPFDIDRATSSDFLYQINRRRKSTTLSHVDLNRLMKWSLPMYAGSSVSKYACELDLDINTVPIANATIESGRAVDLMNELFELGREIVREGDIP